jgi:hypothetical protein
MNESEMVEQLRKLPAGELVSVRAADLLSMVLIAREHNAMAERVRALEQLMFEWQIKAAESETVQ